MRLTGMILDLAAFADRDRRTSRLDCLADRLKDFAAPAPGLPAFETREILA
jgi:hypothetical protein